MTRKKPTKLDLACWAACPYVRQWTDEAGPLKKCMRCPEGEIRQGAKMQRLCRGMAEEIVKPVLKAIGIKE